MDRFIGDSAADSRTKEFDVVQGVDTVDIVWPMKKSSLDWFELTDDGMKGVTTEVIFVDSNWRRNVSSPFELIELVEVPVPSHAFISEKSKCSPDTAVGENCAESALGLL
jgi:hypothetical protein